jgi:heme oxygenase
MIPAPPTSPRQRSPHQRSLRLRLRAETDADHRRLDRLADGLDLATRDGLGRFLLAHHAAYSELARRNASLSDMMEDRVSRTARDLVSLGLDGPDPARTPSAPIGTTGLLYVVAGSHLGARQLLAIVQGSTDARVRSATRMMDDPGLAASWKELLSQIKPAPADGARADAALDAARTTFGVFERAFEDALGRPLP